VETDFSEAVKAAHESVVGAGLDPDSPAGTAAFQEVLKHLLTAGGSRITPIVENQGEPAEDASPAGRVAQWAAIDDVSVRDIVTFGPEGVSFEIPTRQLPGSKAARQRLLTLMKTALDRIAYGVDEVRGELINSLCHDYDCLDQNLAANLRNYEFVRVRGDRRAYMYRITRDGLDRAREALRDLLRAP